MLRKALGAALAIGLLGVGIYYGRRYLAVRSAPSTEDLLRRAMRADLEAVDYSGETETTTFVPGKQIRATAHILHQAPGRYKVTYLSGPQAGMTVGSNGLMAWRCGTKGEVIEVTNETIAPEEAEKRFPILLQNYELRILYPDDVAGRRVWVIDLKPKHSGNAWKRFWIDREHYVILRSDSYDAKGGLRSRTTFRKIEFGVELSELVFVLPDNASDTTYHTYQQHESARSVSPATLRGHLGFPLRLPTHTPPGYTLEGYYLFDHRCCAGKSVIIRYIDGLNSISVFEAVPLRVGAIPAERRPLAPSGSLSGLGWVAEQFGSSNVVSVLDSSPQIAVVGDLSKAELVRMAESLGTQPEGISPSVGE